MRIALRTLAFASFALMAFGEGRARATVSAITINAPLVSRAGSDGVTLYECPGRGSSVVGCIVESTFQGVGHRDCIDDTQLVFPIQITGLPDTSVNLQVWAGTSDCTQAGATNNASTATCWPVASPPSGLQAVMNVNVRVADLVGPLGVVPPPQVYQAAVASKACNNSSASTTGSSNLPDFRYQRIDVNRTVGVVNVKRYGVPNCRPAALVATASTVTEYRVA